MLYMCVNDVYQWFIHFFFDLAERYIFSIKGLTDCDTENYRSVWHQMNYAVTDKNNNVSFEDLDIHCHCSSFQTRCDSSYNVCLDLHNCQYSICIICNCVIRSLDELLFQFFFLCCIPYHLMCHVISRCCD